MQCRWGAIAFGFGHAMDMTSAAAIAAAAAVETKKLNHTKIVQRD